MKPISVRTILSTAILVTMSASTLITTSAQARGHRSFGSAPAPAPAEAPASATISFIHLNDVHAHLTPHKDLVETNGRLSVVERGGLARVKTMVDGIRADNPNSIFMNIGDTFHGGVEALYTDGNAIVAPINAMGIDIGIPGNWDFAYGSTVTRDRFTPRGASPQGTLPTNYLNLGGNVTNQPLNSEFLPATTTFTFNGVKVGMIGITSDIVRRMHPSFAIRMNFLEGKQQHLDYVQNQADALRADGAEIVVVMSELGIHKDKALADSVNAGSVDVFFSAHTHELTKKPLTSASGALVVEAGNDSWLGRMDIVVKDNKVTERNWQVLAVDNSIAENAEIKALVDAARAPFLADDINMDLPNPILSEPLTQPIDTVIGNTAQRLDRRHVVENTFNKAFTDAARTISGTDIAMTPGFRFDAVVEDNSVSSGDITLEEAYRFFPVPFNIATANTTVAHLKQVIEMNMTFVYSTDTFKHSGGWEDGFSGLDITADLANADGSRVIELSLSGSNTPLADSDVISITGCVRPVELSQDTLCAYPGFTEVTDLAAADGSTYTGITLFKAALTNGVFADQQHTTVTDRNNTVFWPEADFIQPIEGVTR